MRRFMLAGLGALCAVAVFGPAAVASADRPPNLVVILTDDQGYADVGFNGCRDIPTPHIDRIAQGGVRCTSGYVTYAVCGPSRAGLITGRYQDRFGCSRNPTIDPSVANNGVPVSEKNIAELLKPVGYTSMAVGKWHLGTHRDLRPLVRGFDRFYGFLGGGHNYMPEMLTTERIEDVDRKWGWYSTKVLDNDRPVAIDKYLTDALSDAAVQFIGDMKDKPFFLYLAYNAPHGPLQATDKYLKRFAHIGDRKRRTYAAMVAAVDDGVGRVLAELSKQGVDEHTIVFFLSDNGGAKNNGSINLPLRAHKGTPYEGGIRVPFAVRWPGRIPAGMDYHKPVSALDIAATIVAHCGAKPQEGKPLDGVDLVPYLDGTQPGSPHQRLHWRFYDAKRYVVRDGDRKLIVQPEKDDELFDLAADLSEKSNLAAGEAEQIARMRRHIEAWAKPMVEPRSGRLGSWEFGKK
jgi:arylsulfatase A-like enzyme